MAPRTLLSRIPLIEGSPLEQVSLAFLSGLFLAWEGEEAFFWALFGGLFLWWFLRREGALFLLVLFLAFVYGTWRFVPPRELRDFPWDREVRFEAEVIKPPLKLKTYTRLEIRLRRLLTPEERKLSLKARLYAPPFVPLAVGDVFRASVRWRRPRGFWNPFGYDTPKALKARGIYLVGRLSRKAPPEVFYRASGLYLQKIRAELFAFAAGLSDPSRGLFEALVLGEKTGLSPELRSTFRYLGLSHFLAVSGLHLALLSGLVFILVRALVAPFPRLLLWWPRQYWGLCGAVLVGGFYVLLSGPSPSALRAYVMLLVFFTAHLFWREPRALDNLALAVLLILFLWPQAVGTLSFRLSVAAVFGLILASRLKRRWDFWPRGKIISFLAEVAFYSTAATFFTAPLLLLSFGGVALLAPLSNLLALPIFAGFVLPLEILAVLLLPLAKGLALKLATLPGLLLSHLPAIRGPVFTPPLPVGSFLLGLIPALGAVFTRRRLLWLGLGLGLEIALIFFYRGINLVTVLDVGQGSAALAKIGEKALLFDAGPKRGDFDTGAMVVGSTLRKLGLRRLDMVVISHPQADHLGGLWGLSREIPVEKILVGSFERAGLYQELLRDFGPKVFTVDQKTILDFGEATLDLWPGRLESPLSQANREGLVARFCLREGKGPCFLFPGDIDFVREKRLLAESLPLRADIFVLAHHGSRSSNSLSLLKAVRPSLALSSARSRYHPSPRTLRRLQELGIPHLSTKERGAVSILVWRGKVWVCTEAARRRESIPYRALWPLWPVGCRPLHTSTTH